MKFELNTLATIHTPFNSLENMPVQPCGADETIGKIIFKKEYEKGLKDLDGFSHVYLIYCFHKVQNHALEVVPFNDHTDTDTLEKIATYLYENEIRYTAPY
ncbi:MAG: SAM-dependent methyltransferase [Campylobacterales bacterium]|nr:SAM-dependent methyltransferase [Campylobacterales bacterium]